MGQFHFHQHLSHLFRAVNAKSSFPPTRLPQTTARYRYSFRGFWASITFVTNHKRAVGDDTLNYAPSSTK